MYKNLSNYNKTLDYYKNTRRVKINKIYKNEPGGGSGGGNGGCSGGGGGGRIDDDWYNEPSDGNGGGGGGNGKGKSKVACISGCKHYQNGNLHFRIDSAYYKEKCDEGHVNVSAGGFALFDLEHCDKKDKKDDNGGDGSDGDDRPGGGDDNPGEEEIPIVGEGGPGL